MCWLGHTEDNLPNISNQNTRLVSMNVERDLWFENQNRTLDDIAESVQNTFGCKSNPFSTKNVTRVQEGKTLNKDQEAYLSSLGLSDNAKVMLLGKRVRGHSFILKLSVYSDFRFLYVI